MKKIKLLFLALALSTTAYPVTESLDSELRNKTGWFYHVDALMGMAVPLDLNYAPYWAMGANGSADYFFYRRLGVNLGFTVLKQTIQTAPKSRQILATYFVDLNAGLAIKFMGDIFTEKAENFGQFGVYLSIPTGDFSGLNLPSKHAVPFVGLYVSGSTVYSISDSFALGPTAMFKAGLTSSDSYSDPLWPNVMMNLLVGLRGTF